MHNFRYVVDEVINYNVIHKSYKNMEQGGPSPENYCGPTTRQKHQQC